MSDLIPGLILLTAFACLCLLAVPAAGTLMTPVFVALGLRASLAIAGVTIWSLPGSGGDAVGFLAAGRRIAQSGLPSDEVISGANLYRVIIAGLLRVDAAGGPFLALALNVILGTLLVAVVAFVVNASYGKRAGLMAGFIIALWPTEIVFSAILLREMFFSLFLAAAIGALIRPPSASQIGTARLWWAAIFLGSAASFHIGALFGFVGLFAIVTLERIGRGVQIHRRMALALVTAGLLAIFVTSGLATSRLAVLNSLSADNLGDFEAHVGKANTNYLSSFQRPSSLYDLALQTPIRTVFFLLAPFPWALRGASDAVGAIDAALYAAVILILLKNRRGFRDPSARRICWVIVPILCVMAVGTTNWGTAIRHRAKLAPPLVLLAFSVVAEARRRPTTQRKRFPGVAPIEAESPFSARATTPGSARSKASNTVDLPS